MVAVQFVVFAAALLIALFAVAHPRYLGTRLQQAAERLATSFNEIRPGHARLGPIGPTTDRCVRAIALAFALLFIVILCGLVLQLATGS